MAKKKISLAKEEKKVNSLTAKFNKWYCCPDDALDYLMQTGEVSHNGKKYTLNENELLVARYGRENAEDILKSRMRRNKESNTGNKKGKKNAVLVSKEENTLKKTVCIFYCKKRIYKKIQKENL